MVEYYARLVSSREDTLNHKRAQQKLKVEELKKKTGYYAAKNLIERYENGGEKLSTPTKDTALVRRASFECLETNQFCLTDGIY